LEDVVEIILLGDTDEMEEGKDILDNGIEEGATLTGSGIFADGNGVIVEEESMADMFGSIPSIPTMDAF